MVRPNWNGLCVAAIGAAMLASAQTHAAPVPGAAGPSEGADSLASWKWCHEVPLPAAAHEASPWCDFILPISVFDEARADLGDLRLYDGDGREAPFALRVRRTQDEQQPLSAKQFNRQENPDRSAQVNLDLGHNPPEHQEIDVVTKGADFRRRVQVLGGDDGQKWGVLLDNAWIIDYRVESQVVDIHRLRYAPSRFRYLQVRVFPDMSQAEDKPDIASATVYHAVQTPGEYVTRPAELKPREAVRAYGAPGSAWGIDLGGDQAPLERLAFDVTDSDFSRAYVLEKIEGEGARAVIARGEWRRRPDEERRPLEIQLANEVAAHRLRLVVIDHANAPLGIQSARYTAPARQVVFARKGLTAPMRLYAGNPRAESPHYDFAANLPAALQPAPQRVQIGQPEPNPVFQPEPKPWTERWPWLVYVVLGTASVILLAILAVLARKAMTRHDAVWTTSADV
jgi:hypothetical protein